MSSPSVRDMLIGTFLPRLNIVRSGHTSILQISVTSRNPALASLIVNTLIDNYIERSFHDNYAATEKISGWLNAQLNDLKENLGKSQTQMIAYQKDLGIVGVDPKDSILVTSLEELNKQLAERGSRPHGEGGKPPDDQDSPPDVIDAGLTADPALQATKQSLAQVTTEYTLIQTYGPVYPRVKAMKAQMDQLDKV